MCLIIYILIIPNPEKACLKGVAPLWGPHLPGLTQGTGKGNETDGLKERRGHTHGALERQGHTHGALEPLSLLNPTAHRGVKEKAPNSGGRGQSHPVCYREGRASSELRLFGKKQIRDLSVPLRMASAPVHRLAQGGKPRSSTSKSKDMPVLSGQCSSVPDRTRPLTTGTGTVTVSHALPTSASGWVVPSACGFPVPVPSG